MESSGKVENLQDVVRIVLSVNSAFKGQVWWRGQRDQAWPLSPSVFREERWAESETSYVERFQHKAPSRHPRVPAYEDRAGWLFLMQHYRLPTRLLDWTESPLIAAFFAAQKDKAAIDHPSAVQDSDGAVFALSPYRLNEDQVHESALIMPGDEHAKPLIDRAFSSRVAPKEYIVAVRPSEVDLRLVVQLSVFTIHGMGAGIDTLPKHSSFLRKYSVPSGAKAHLLEELKYVGIRDSSIFPDLEHLAADVASTTFRKPHPPQDEALGYVNIPPRDPEASS
jgi:hypothetical protein